MKAISLILLLVGLLVGFFLGRGGLGFLGGKLFTNPTISNPLKLSCSYKGKTYNDGEGFKDKCNSCSCTNGQVQCTTMACE